MAAVDTAEAVAAFMAAEVVEGVSTAAAVAASPVVEAGPGGDLTRLRPPATEVLVVPPPTLPGTGVGTRRGRATIILGLAAILRAGISGMEIPPRRPPLSPADNGILLAAHREPADLPEHNPQPVLLRIREASTSLAGTAERELPAGCEAFQARVARSMRIHPRREMLFQGLNLFPRFTIRSTAHSLQIQGSGQNQRSLLLRAWQADQGSWETRDSLVAQILSDPITKRAD